MFDFNDLLQNWQEPLASLVVGAILSWITKHFLFDHRKAVTMAISILEALEGTIKQVLGEKWAPVYDALLKAAEAAVDGDVTADEAYDVGVTAFETALKITGVQISDGERSVLLGILKFVVTALCQNTKASKVAMRSVRTSLRARGVL